MQITSFLCLSKKRAFVNLKLLVVYKILKRT
jgi:hypothetical protein